MTIFNTEKFARMTRQELTFAACDALAVNGRKPSVALVREQTIILAGIKKGSDGDVQEDIRLWYDGLPERMATLFRATWRGAVELAQEGVAGERMQLEQERERAATDVARARDLAESMRQELALANATIDARDAAIARLDGASAQQQAEIVQLTAKLGAREERIEALTAELARKAAEQAAAFTELDGARKHALLQIDQARGEGCHWKEQYERGEQGAQSLRAMAETYRGRAGNLEAELAGVKGRLQALEDGLASERRHGAALSAQLADEQERARRQAADLASARIAVEAANARLESAARELAAAAELRGPRPAPAA